jgi:hypothetical protein
VSIAGPPTTPPSESDASMARCDAQSTALSVEPSVQALAAWSIIAAFGAYFCMYAFRKPFTAASFSDATVWGLGQKTVLVTAQVLGYTLSKCIGIRVIAETPPRYRAAGILILIGVAEAALLLFAVVPPPLHVLCLFLNGLPLGMVFGLVLGYLEGRRDTEIRTAGLCASFILADGATKSVGTWLLQQGVSERWMPALAGLLFVPPLFFFVWMLTRVPPPGERDIAQRTERATMSHRDRIAMLRRHGVGLFLIVLAFLLVTIARSIRADFAPEIWRSLGTTTVPATFANSEVLVALGVLIVNGSCAVIVDNRRAFFAGIGIGVSGGLLMLAALVGLLRFRLDAFPFMVLLGLGLYLPYVAVHTTIFERLISMTRDRANLGFLMYVADSAGYLGYAALILGRGFIPADHDLLRFFIVTCGLVALLSCASLVSSWHYFARSVRPDGNSIADGEAKDG